VNNDSDFGVTVVGTVELTGRHHEVLGTMAIPPTFIPPHSTVYVNGMVCQERPGQHPYKLRVHVDAGCDDADRQRPVNRDCGDHPGVLPKQWYYGYVTNMLAEGVVSGYADGTFRPNNAVTRGQMAKMVVLAFGLPLNTAGGRHFSDVPASHPEYAYIETAYNDGILRGYANGTFRPGANVTRSQAAKIVVVAAGWQPAGPRAASFRDVPAGSPFYGYVEVAYAHGLLTGYADGTFRPGNSITRAQACKMLYGFVADTDEE
jgi:hypothetical protein